MPNRQPPRDSDNVGDSGTPEAELRQTTHETRETHNVYSTRESNSQMEPDDSVALLAESLKGNILENKLLLWVVQGLVTVLLIIGGYIMKTTINRLDTLETETRELQLWRSETANTRLTSADGLAIWKEISAIKEHIAGIPNNAPPAWFLQRVDHLENTLSENSRKMDLLSAEMQAHLRSTDHKP